MKKTLFILNLILLINVAFSINIKQNSTFEPVEIVEEILPEIMQKTINENDLDNSFLEEYYVFVLNIVEINEENSKMSFSTDFITKENEFNRVNPTHYIIINKKIVLIKGCTEEILDKFKFKRLNKIITKKVRNRLYYSSNPMLTITARGYASIVFYEQDNYSINYIRDEWSVPDIFRKYNYIDYLDSLRLIKHENEDSDSLDHSPPEAK